MSGLSPARRILLMAAAGLACLMLAGLSSLARLAFWAGAPGTAGWQDDAAARGIAFYRDGDYSAADAAFAEAGRSETFNRALTLAATGRYALSVAYLDAVLFVDPADTEARRLRGIIDALVPKTVGTSVVRGHIPAAVGTASANTGDGVVATPDPELKKPIEARGIVASDAWLDTIADDPGAYLRLRLRKEFERRAALGLIGRDGDSQ
ncbi:hypothetical protein [Xanthobacter aminoxidans]|uniref:hypothetical protein n=1 Tax=Xanthobacter aminoxidans TaxID=186280 RepID=UPI002022C39D|nr:hypothetical protein [Xanthobacter aminoxidans]MCL8384576.1 hypothetical protein [Xanthobacter aminoxidans]